MGFPLHYTAPCLGKRESKGSKYNDARLTLLGNSWSVPVVAWLLNQLFSPLGICQKFDPQGIVDLCRPGAAESLQAKLIRLPLSLTEPDTGDPYKLAFKLCNLVSLKGEDIMLTTPSTQLVEFHRLRASVPTRLWRWQVVSGWRWTRGREHINCLELRAILNALRWRLERQKQFGFCMLHLTDSLVCLHILTRGRTSSKKLRSTMARINALLLASSSQVVWGYVTCRLTPTLPTSLVGGGGMSKRSLGMPKRILEGGSEAEQAKQRRQLGSLKSLTVQPSDTMQLLISSWFSCGMKVCHSLPPVTRWTPLFATIWNISGSRAKDVAWLATRLLGSKTYNLD